LKVALAEAEARAGNPDSAIAIVDEALATCGRAGNRAFEPELNRARGEILPQRDPASPAPAEEALETAIAVAERLGTRSFGLRAALSLAKLYQSTGRLDQARLAGMRRCGAATSRCPPGRTGTRIHGDRAHAGKADRRIGADAQDAVLRTAAVGAQSCRRCNDRCSVRRERLRRLATQSENFCRFAGSASR
jgi:hypothetical protein